MSNTASLSNANANRGLVAVILAAGKGTRMQSDIPKVMHPVLGRPMVHWVVDAARAAGATKVILVIGHGAEMIREYFAGVPELRNTVEFVLQDKLLGTGHAVMMAKPNLEANAANTDAFVLCGDGPLIRAETLTTLLSVHRRDNAAATLATSLIADPKGYGRIVRDSAGKLAKIVEQKDAGEAERAICEVNPSYYCFRADELFSALARVGNKNASGEYYITDVFEILRNDGRTVAAVDAVPAADVLSVNDPAQLAEVDSILRARHRTPSGSAR
ncbi:MAG: Bifunctional protein GlmU [Planctomycetota bacterium]|jgi:bifunctional UDP-N-acetylglucosamine pyrophosphorylase/glucosamine-1-phosphate N-acetyltransferase